MDNSYIVSVPKGKIKDQAPDGLYMPPLPTPKTMWEMPNLWRTIPQSKGKSNTKEKNADVYAYGQRVQGHDGVIRTGILACGRARSRL